MLNTFKVIILAAAVSVAPALAEEVSEREKTATLLQRLSCQVSGDTAFDVREAKILENGVLYLKTPKRDKLAILMMANDGSWGTMNLRLGVALMRGDAKKPGLLWALSQPTTVIAREFKAFGSASASLLPGGTLEVSLTRHGLLPQAYKAYTLKCERLD